MNIFKSESAPFLLALIASLVGWYFTQLTDELGTMKIATYRISDGPEAGSMQLDITNVSRTKALAGAEFSISCPSSQACLELVPGSQGEYGKPSYPPPTGPASAAFKGDSPDEILMNLSLVAGAGFSVVYYPKAGMDLPLFFYTPTGNENDLYLVEEGSAIGFLARDYVAILFWGFAASLTASVLWIAISAIASAMAPRGKELQEDEANEGGTIGSHQPYVVHVHYCQPDRDNSSCPVVSGCNDQGSGAGGGGQEDGTTEPA